jgi:probable addiction module antidote protein
LQQIASDLLANPGIPYRRRPMAIRTIPFDAAEHIRSPEDQIALLNDALTGNNAAYISNALGVIVRARGMTEVARFAGVTRRAWRPASAAGGPTVFAALASSSLPTPIACHDGPIRGPRRPPLRVRSEAGLPRLCRSPNLLVGSGRQAAKRAREKCLSWTYC